MERKRYNLGAPPVSVTDDLPGCCICFMGFTGRGYNDSRKERVPLVLKCTHSSCENCILACLNSNKPITCALCKKVSPLPPRQEDIKDVFPVNLHLLGLWSKITKEHFGGGDSQVSFPKKVVKKELVPKKNFSSCNECTGPANCFCESCRTTYCHLCFKKVHSAAKVLRDHKSVSLIPELSATAVKNAMCSVHPNNKLDFFCTPCSISICSACLVSEHNGHNLQSISDKNKEFVDEIIASYARVTDILNIMKTSNKKAKKSLKCSDGTSSNTSYEQRIKHHFMQLHAHLQIMENELIHKLNSSTRATSLNAAIDQLSDYMSRITTILTKTKTVMKSEVCSDFGNILRELRELEDLPCVLVASENDVDMNCLSIDQSIFCTLNEHIVLRADDAVSFLLKTENDAPDEALEELPKTCSLEEIKAQLFLPSQPIMPSTPSAGILSAEYAAEKSGRAVSPTMSRWSSSSSLSSNNSFAIEATQLLAPPDDLVVGITFKAFVSHITSPSDFYIQRFGVRRKLESLQRELRRFGTSSARKKDDLVYQAGQYYMTMYSGDYNWSRCQILDFIGVDEVKVLYIDFGNHQTILKSNLRPLPSILAQIAPLAVRCSIVNCYPRRNSEWDPRVPAVMSRMLTGGKGSTCITIVRKNQLHCLTVKLYKETDTNTIDIGEALIFLEYAQSGPADSFTPDIEKVAIPKPYPAQTLLRPEDVLHRTVDITHVVSPDEFYIILIPIAAELAILRSSMHKNYTTSDKRLNDSRIVYYPSVGMAVAVPNENGFYRRALVTEMLPNKCVRVFLIDDGPTWDLEWDKLRTLELKYFKLPPQAYRCSMADIQPQDGQTWQEESIDLIKSYVGENLRIANPVLHDLHTSVLLVHCDTEVDVCVNALLVRKGFAKSIGPYGEIVEYPKVPDLVKPSEPVSKAKEFKIVQRPAPQTAPVKPEQKQEVKMDPNDERVIIDPNGQYKLKVKVLRVVNPGEFYITIDCHEEIYKEMGVMMNKFYNNINLADVERWQLGDKCAVKLEDGSWKRGLVIEQPEDDQHVKVKLVDEVDTVSVSLTAPCNLAVLDSQFDSVVDSVFQCILGGIVPAGSSCWTLTSISEMEDFISKFKNQVYIAYMKPLPEDSDSKKILRVLLLGRKKSEPTAVAPEYESWLSLNHTLRWKGCAKADEHTKWDHKGNIINEENNAMEDEQVVLNSLLKSAFQTTPEGKVDLSKPLSDNSEVVKIKWLPAEPLPTLTFMARTTFVGSNCEIWIQDTLNASVTLNVINEEATKLCDGTDPPNPPIPWGNGDICLARYHLDNKWYRSEIRQINATPNHHLVRFVDYGNEEYLENHELRLADGMTMRPVQAHVCYFDNLAPIGDTWLASHIHEIHTLVVDKHVRVELRQLVNNLLGIQSMILPEGKNALHEIVCRHLGVYRTNSTAALKVDSGLDPSPDDPLSATASSYGSVIDSDTSTAYQCISAGEEDVGSHGEGAGSSGCPIINWLNLYETEDMYKLPPHGFKLLTIPLEVNEMKVDITSILSPELCMIQVSTTDNAELNSIKTSYDELLHAMQQEAEYQPYLEPPYLYKDCCCKFESDDMWYRAVVIHDSSGVDGSLVIQFVDYGNVQKSQVNQLKQMKDEWFCVPVQSIPCLIDGYRFRYGVLESEAMVYLQNVLIDQPFVKAIIKKRKKNLSVEFYNEEGNLLYQPLIDDQYLIPSSSG